MPGVKTDKSQKILPLLRRHLVVGLLKPPDLVRFGGEALDRLHPAHAFAEQQDHFVRQFAVAQIGRAQPRRIIMRHPPQRQRHAQAGHRQRRLDAPHENPVGRQRQNHVHPLQQHAIHEQPRVLHVARHAVENRIGTVDIEEAEAQPLQLRVKLVAQFRHDFPLGQPRRGHVVGVSERRAQHRLRHNRERQRRDNPQRLASLPAAASRMDTPAAAGTGPAHNRITSITTPNNLSPAMPSSSNTRLNTNDHKQSARNRHANANSRRTSSPVA